jgi:hypothetical protein
MPNTTNYSFPTPADTDLVKNGADAIRDLGDAVDTAMNTALGTKKAGMVLLNTTSFSAVASQSINDVFSATYENYFVVVTLTAASANNSINLRLRVSGSDDTAGNYNTGGFICRTTSSTLGGQDANAQTSFELGGMASTSTQNSYVMEILKPFIAERAGFRVSAGGSDSTSGYGRYTAGFHNANTSYTGFSVFCSTGTITGKVATYGRNF